MALQKQTVSGRFNKNLPLPYSLRLSDFKSTMEDVYDFFFDVNASLEGRGLDRLENMLRRAILSGVLSELVTESLAKHSRGLVVNRYHNGHPDLVKRGRYKNNSVKSGKKGVEIKTTVRKGGAVDTHGARDQWFCVFVYQVDNVTQPATARAPLRFTEIYLAKVTTNDFRKNSRSELGTRTATLDRDGVKKLRKGWVYLDP